MEIEGVEIFFPMHERWAQSYGVEVARIMVELECEIDSLCSDINYVSWQQAGFEITCWEYLQNPESLPDEKKCTMGAAYNLVDAQNSISRMKVLSDKLCGAWLRYINDEEITLIDPSRFGWPEVVINENRLVLKKD